jgi:hypothetical protein
VSRKLNIPKIYAKDSFRIPLCSECGEEMVRFRGKWVCRTDMKLPVRTAPGKNEEIPFGALYPNRESRRRK